MTKYDDLDPQLSFFRIIPDFDAQSRNGSTCSISNLNKQLPALGRKPHEVDDFILRGPLTDFEGFIDIRPSVIVKTAEELGMVTAERHAEAQNERYEAIQELVNAKAEAAAYQQELDVLRSALKGLFDEEPRPSEDALDTLYEQLPEDV